MSDYPLINLDAIEARYEVGAKEILSPVEVLRMVGHIRRLETKLKDFELLFSLQQTRMQQAIELWRAESPADRANVFPDLGQLLDWLIQRGNRGVDGQARQ